MHHKQHSWLRFDRLIFALSVTACFAAGCASETRPQEPQEEDQLEEANFANKCNRLYESDCSVFLQPKDISISTITN